MKKTIPDFAKIEPHQLAMHDRLRNWSRWVSVQPARQVSSMFKLYRAPQHWEEKAFREPCDLIDAQVVEKLVCGLPMHLSSPLKWSYVYDYPIGRACSSMGMSRETLHRNLREARQALINLSEK